MSTDFKTPYKRYLVFAWNSHDAAGGEHDVEGSFETEDEFEAFISQSHYKVFDILDFEERRWLERKWV